MKSKKLTADTFQPLMAELLLHSRTTLSGLSRKSGLDRNTLDAWHKGKNGPSLFSFCQLLDAMGKELIVRDKP